jgi:hypothetical protein
MTKRKVYISSTFKDFEYIRNFIINIVIDKDILGNYYDTEYIMESMKTFGKSEDALKQCLNAVYESDVYILIIGNWYGSTIKYKANYYISEYENEEMEFSYTRHEYESVKNNTNKRIYILHSDSKFDKEVSDEINKFCDEKNISIDLNNNNVELFKSASIKGRANPVTFSSLDELKDKINKCFISDIAHYSLSLSFNNVLGLNSKNGYLIDRKKQDDEYENFKNRNIGKTLKIIPSFIFTTYEDKSNFYSMKLWYNKWSSTGLYNVKILKSSDYDKLSEDPSIKIYNLIQDTLPFLIDKSDENIYSIDKLAKELESNKFQRILEFEVAKEDIKCEKHNWINLITTYLNELNDKIVNNIVIDKRIYAVIHVIYDKKEISQVDMNNYIEKIINLFPFVQNINNKIGTLNLGELGLISKSDIQEWANNSLKDYPQDIEKINSNLLSIPDDAKFSYQEIINDFNLKIKQ